MTEDTAPIETIEVDEADLPPEVDSNEPAQYHSLLEVWRAVLEPAAKGDMVNEPISPQWATKIVGTYQEIRYADCGAVHLGMFDLVAELSEILDDEIATDDSCLQVTSAEEDVAENSEHYRNLLTAWQVHLLAREVQWSPGDPDAAVQLAVISEVHNMFFGQTGLTAHLDNIKFQFTEADQQELANTLQQARAEALGGKSE